MRYFVLFLLLLLIGCKTKAPVVETQTVYDTVYRDRVERISVPIDNTIVIEEPCDSLGVLKRFKQTLNVSGTKVVVESKNGNIQAQINLDSIKSVWEKDYKAKVVTKTVFVDRPVPEPYVPKWVKILATIGVLGIIYAVLRIASIFYIPLRWIP